MMQNHDDYLTGGVVFVRCFAAVLDLVIVALLTALFYWALAVLGVLAVVPGYLVAGAMSGVPIAYNLLSLMRPCSATPGQAFMGLTVRRNDDFGPPTVAQSVIFIVLYYATMATSGLLLLVALFTPRHRTLHDWLSGLVVVRRRSLVALTESLTPAPEPWTMYHGSLDRPA